MLWLGLRPVILFLICLRTARGGGKQRLRSKHNFFLLSSKSIKPSSRPHGLLVYGAVPSVSKVGRRPGKEVGQWARPFGGSRRCAQALPPAPSLAPRYPWPPGPAVPQHPGSREVGGAPPAAGVSGGTAGLPRTPGPQVAHGLRTRHARPSARRLELP